MTTIVPRDIRFDFDAVPKDWHGGRLSVSLFYDALAVCFPAGERFFVASVKAHRDDVQDPALQADVAAFCAQEGHHGREHERYNQMMRAQGLPVDAIERRVLRMLRFTTRVLSSKAQLAITSALEHFTALLGVLVLENAGSVADAHPTMAALWRWHSAEENEHKAVAFDVFKAAGGSWWTRVWTMAFVSATFWPQLALAYIGFMRSQRVLLSWREHRELLRYLFQGNSGLHSILRPYLRYYAPGFHPNESDTRPLVEAWRSAP